LISFFSYKYFEKPLNKYYRDKLTKKTKWSC
jgi:hypothetical protein